MNAKILFLMLGIISSAFKSQVGINTKNPQATLDVNGDVRIRKVDTLATPENGSRILVLSNNNTVNQTDADHLLPKKIIVKGLGGTGFSLLSISLLNGWLQVSFPTLEIDDGNNYSLSQQEFITPKTGIYNVYFFLEMASLLSASTTGIGIFKIDISGNTTLLCEESFANINVLGIGVSPPTRSTQTIVKLNKGDKITFGMRGVVLSNISLLANSNAQFSILQER
ncbi:hypothetical protein NZD88_01645 [Chryseobacterium antibioticum]|uniref:C1q domain-containing protein n=1 Tax=Chryseobacterium pyrolae TaxID=2987481 RepID=A0ABT2ICA2_9FLAO|nr:hypothetical protein [Chryseobacterium pyrolae]MCT2406256.1 hypothetical protein [Chryseobacterium pyrolae]